PGSVQFLLRRDDNLALIHCGRRLAAEGNSVIANDVDAHWWGRPVGVGPVPTVTTLTLSSPRKATPFRIILWRCSATAEHEIAQPKPRDPGINLFRSFGHLSHCCPV